MSRNSIYANNGTLMLFFFFNGVRIFGGIPFFDVKYLMEECHHILDIIERNQKRKRSDGQCQIGPAAVT